MRATTVTSAMTAATAALGSVGTDPGSAWYQSLEKPSWQPPPGAFPLVWTPLYAAIAYGTGRAIEQAEPRRRKRLWALTTANLAANAGWSWTFFRGHSLPGGLAVIAALNLLNDALLVEAWRSDRRAAAALTPYAGWVAFATALNADLWRRNR